MTPTHSSLTINQLFTTPVYTREWGESQEQNKLLEKFIYDEKNSSKGVILSNRGGWQSSDDLFQREAEYLQVFRNWVISSVIEIYQQYYMGKFSELLKAENINITFECTAWANVNTENTSNKLHNHPGSHWSGVYYVKAPPCCGNIEFLDPRMGANMVSARHRLLDIFGEDWISVEPRTGMTVIFPSWLYHSVGENHSPEDRISIAFNVGLRKA